MRLGTARRPLKRCVRRRDPAVGAEAGERSRCGCLAGATVSRSFPTTAMSREPEIMESRVMWEPDTKRNTHMDRFRAAVAGSCGLRLGERWAGAGGEAQGLCAGLALPRAVRPPQRGVGVPGHPPTATPGAWSGRGCGMLRGGLPCGRERADGRGRQPYLCPGQWCLLRAPGAACGAAWGEGQRWSGPVV